MDSVTTGLTIVIQIILPTTILSMEILMTTLARAAFVAALLGAEGSVAADLPSAVPQALAEYLRRPEPAFEWKLDRTSAAEGCTIHELTLVSQRWQGIVWKHALQVFEPDRIDHPDHMLLFVTGGRTGRAPKDEDNATRVKLAQLCRARIAVLHQVPNQPLLGGHVEDDLITETWLKYLETGDATWPLLFPMAKSAVKAMDALDQFAKSRGRGAPKGFVITGASKRGWTSWLTAAADKRIVGTAPIVIDVLDFRAQMNHQLETWGAFSEQIGDYTRKGLVKRPGEQESAREAQLRRMMDPFTYRSRLTVPKLLIVGTNDPYWVVDSMNLYWDGLQGEKHIRQVPNAGHGLQGGLEGALATLAVFFRCTVSDAEMPRLSWKFASRGDQVSLTMQCEPRPKMIRVWTARADTKDFRKSQWTPRPLEATGSESVATAEAPEKGHLAIFGELTFEFEGIPWSATTLVYRQ